MTDKAQITAEILPIPMRLICPGCNSLHIDEGAFATKLHHTHSCQYCGLTWRPAVVATVGVQFLPGFKNERAAALSATQVCIYDPGDAPRYNCRSCGKPEDEHQDRPSQSGERELETCESCKTPASCKYEGKCSPGYVPLSQATESAPSPRVLPAGAEVWSDARKHIANEWADMATSGLQWLRNIRDGISPVGDALENMESICAHIRALQDKEYAERVEQHGGESRPLGDGGVDGEHAVGHIDALKPCVMPQSGASLEVSAKAGDWTGPSPTPAAHGLSVEWRTLHGGCGTEASQFGDRMADALDQMQVEWLGMKSEIQLLQPQLAEARREIERLEAECFSLAANQCHKPLALEGGDHGCEYQQQHGNAEARCSYALTAHKEAISERDAEIKKRRSAERSLAVLEGKVKEERSPVTRSVSLP